MAQDKMTLEDWLDDLGVRFLINLPQEDLGDIARFCFQIEEAQWFYEDFIRPLDPSLPSMSLKSFSLKMFQHCPLFSAYSSDDHLRAFEQFMEYKTRVPVRGAILLNAAMDSALLVRGYKKGASWSFPRGKINKDELDLDCAVREVYEETGYDLREAGLVERNFPVDYLEVTLKDQQVRLFIFRDVPQDTVFEPKTRKEIGDIKWYKLTDLPAYRKRKVSGKAQGAGSTSNDKFYMVAPFMVQLRQWILKQRKLDPRTAANGTKGRHAVVPEEDEMTEDNVLEKPIAEPAAAPAPAADYIDKTTKELRDLLLGPVPTNKPKDPPPASQPNRGQSILELLRSSGAEKNSSSRPTDSAGGGDYRRPQHPVTPLDHISSEAPQPHTPHHHHPGTQHIPVNAYGRPPSFPYNQNTDTTHSQHRQSRPEIQMTTDQRGLPTIQVAARYYQDKPVQLQHPQPLPPQVQGDKLIQSMMQPPMVPDPNARAQQNYPPQNNQNSAQARQGGFTSQTSAPAPHQLPAHSLSLLNALKGNTAGASSQSVQHQPHTQQHATATPTQYQEAVYAATRSSTENQNGPQFRSGNLNPLDMNKASYPQQNTSASANITDKHRSALLDMFKKSTPPAPQSQPDGQSTHRASPRPAPTDGGQKPNQALSTAEALRATAREQNAPLQMNPETNLPFGAVSILSRPQSGKSTNRTGSAQRLDPNAGQRHIPASSSPLARDPTNYEPAQGKPPNARGQWPSQPQQQQQQQPQPRPSLAQAYPYGASQGTGTSPFSMLPSPPAASTFPMPGVLKPRQDSSSEHRNALLSLFGKQAETSKGKEAAAPGPDYLPGGSVPRSQMASVASNRGGEGVGAGGLLDPSISASRRGSQTPLSPADRNFLLGFLENKARQ